MDWTRDATGRQYMLSHGSYRGLVWHASTGEWNALLSCNGQAVQHTRCGGLEEAQTWIEAQLRVLLSARQDADGCRE